MKWKKGNGIFNVLIKISLQAEEKLLLEEKQRLLKEYESELSELARLDSDVEALVQASLALQSKLGLSITTDRQMKITAKPLSEPIYKIFELFLDISKRNGNND